ncbi:MAG: prephenate dehydratase, partial [Nanoarchaeota archaeon]
LGEKLLWPPISPRKTRRYNNSVRILFEKTVWDVFDAVNTGNAKLGITPIENSISGTVGLTLDALMKFRLNIIDELVLPISHNLAGFGKAMDIKKIYANINAYEQCEYFIRKNFPKAEVIETSSNGQSAKLLMENNTKTTAAIVPEIAVKIYSLKVLKSGIQDNKDNVTRFIVISKGHAEKTGNDRTSIVICPHSDRSGLLYELLGEFAKRKINLTKIESRPSKSKLGNYVFYIDLQGHKSEKPIREAFTVIKRSFFLKILGSYPRKY